MAYIVFIRKYVLIMVASKIIFSVEKVEHNSTEKHANALSPSFTMISVLCIIVVNLLQHRE